MMNELKTTAYRRYPWLLERAMHKVDLDQFKCAAMELMCACPSDDSVEFTGPLYGFIRSRLSRGLSRRMITVGRFASSSGVRSDCSTGQVTVFTIRPYGGVKVEVGRYGVMAAYVYKRDIPRLLEYVTSVEAPVRLPRVVRKSEKRTAQPPPRQAAAAPVELLPDSYAVPDVQFDPRCVIGA